MGNRRKKNMGTSNVGGIKVQDTQLIPYPTKKMVPPIAAKKMTYINKTRPKKKGARTVIALPKRIPYGKYIER